MHRYRLYRAVVLEMAALLAEEDMRGCELMTPENSGSAGISVY
jgi:hypothetical protein